MTKHHLQKGKLMDPRALVGVAANVPVLLAFSGGADSVALLDMLQKEQPSNAPILLVHVNHGIRGEEALRDRAFCEQVAKERGLEIVIFDIDVPKLAKKKGQSLEEAAREERYSLFADLMKERNIPLLLTAHHADDHLETVLFRIARGTGLSGLAGIAPVRPFADGHLVRPLLGFSKQDILNYCEEQKLDFVTDSTNADTAYARNRIRADVVPGLESLYTDVAHRAVRMSAELAEDEAYLEQMAVAFVEQNTTAHGVSVPALKEAHPAIRRRALQVWFQKEKGTSLEAIHLQALTDLIVSGDITARIALPTGVSAYCTARGRLMLNKTKPQPIGEYTLPLMMGENQIPNTDISICITRIQNVAEVSKSDENAVVLFGEWEDLQKTFAWRNRREGDVILRGKMHRKLRRLYAQMGMPAELRRALPLLCVGEEVVWAPFVGKSDDFAEKMKKETSSPAYKIEINVPNNAF